MLPKSKSKSRSKRARGKQSSASPSSPALSKQPQSKKHGKKKKKKRRKASCGNVAGSKLLDPWHDEGIFRTRMMAFVFDPVVPELEVEGKRRISFSGSKSSARRPTRQRISCPSLSRSTMSRTILKKDIQLV